METARLASEPVCDYVYGMQEITLYRSEYRRLDRPNRWFLVLECLRHPIYAFMAYQALNPDPPETRNSDSTLLFAAIAHGIAGWLLLSR